MRFKRQLFAAVLGLTLISVCASACPVCSGTTKGDQPWARWAIIGTTAGLIALPATMVTGIALWIFRNR